LSARAAPQAPLGALTTLSNPLVGPPSTPSGKLPSEIWDEGVNNNPTFRPRKTKQLLKEVNVEHLGSV